MFSPEEINRLRQQFPALYRQDDNGHLPIYFDGPGGSQVPQCVIDAISAYFTVGNSNMGGFNHAGQQTIAINHLAREQANVWLGGQAHKIIFGLNATSLMFMLSRTVAKTWQAGDNIVLSSLDHYSHVSSWQSAAQDAGVSVRMIPLNEVGDDLDYQRAATLIDQNTKLVAFSLASNLIGTVTNAQTLIGYAKSVGAWTSIDAVHAAVHLSVDAHALDVDFVFASAYKIGGSHLGMLCAKDARLEMLAPYKVEPATNQIPMAFEQGTQSFEAQAGFVAMMRYWSALAQDGGDVLTSTNKHEAYERVVAYEQRQSEYILAKFAQRPFLQLYGKKTAHQRTPTFAFNVIKDGVVQDGLALSKFLGQYNIALGFGNFYAQVLAQALSETGGVLRLGCLHYTSFDEIDTLFERIDQGVAQIYNITI